MDWLAQTSGTTLPLGNVWGTDAHNVWAIGEDEMILKWNGTDWTLQRSKTGPNDLWTLWGSSCQ